jgi:glycosyltransferase involved in cell wall biosynthesis
MIQNRYILLTAAKNEEAYISEAITSVLRQTVRPLAWFIMDDGSTDKTASIIERYAEQHPFIRLDSASYRGGRNFGSQYKAIQAAYQLAKSLEFDFVGVQDADIAPEQEDYYQLVFKKFQKNPRLGVAGGFIYERSNGIWQSRRSNTPDSVAGGIQMFRRSCFERIGGYTPLPYGGSDWLAQLNAKMAGWEVLAFPELHVFHYRCSSTANGRLRGYFQIGVMEASMGSHPFFEFLKCGRHSGARPSSIFYSGVRFSGFLWWIFTGRKPLIGSEAVAFLRREQKAKIAKLFRVISRRARLQQKNRDAGSDLVDYDL